MVHCPICNKPWKSETIRMQAGRTCSKLCSSIKGYLSGERKETGIELKLQTWLAELDIPFETQIPLLGITVADIVIRPNVAVFADGTYWHSGEQAAKDRQITRKLQRAGYEVWRFPEELIDSDEVKTKTLLKRAYGSREAPKDL